MTNQAKLLPIDLEDALLVGRVWRPAPVDGPAVVAVRRGRLVDITAHAATVSDLNERLLERVIEEQAKGDPARASELRLQLQASMGSNLSEIKPGSEAAMRLKAELSGRGLWSQYMEVGIGPDAEVFTKSQPMSAVGHGADVGLHPSSHWNNPEPEIVLAANSRGEVVGATLGNDVNLRDIEGWAKPRTTTVHAPSAPSSACSTRTSRSTPCARRK
jgi:fumarylacetoacetate (FAA) hydrolase family protein